MNLNEPSVVVIVISTTSAANVYAACSVIMDVIDIEGDVRLKQGIEGGGCIVVFFGHLSTVTESTATEQYRRS